MGESYFVRSLAIAIFFAAASSTAVQAEVNWVCPQGYYLANNGWCYQQQSLQPTTYDGWPAGYMSLDGLVPTHYPHLRTGPDGHLWEKNDLGVPSPVRYNANGITGPHAEEIRQWLKSLRDSYPQWWQGYRASLSGHPAALAYLDGLDSTKREVLPPRERARPPGPSIHKSRSDRVRKASRRKRVDDDDEIDDVPSPVDVAREEAPEKPKARPRRRSREPAVHEEDQDEAPGEDIETRPRHRATTARANPRPASELQALRELIGSRVSAETLTLPSPLAHRLEIEPHAQLSDLAEAVETHGEDLTKDDLDRLTRIVGAQTGVRASTREVSSLIRQVRRDPIAWRKRFKEVNPTASAALKRLQLSGAYPGCTKEVYVGPLEMADCLRSVLDEHSEDGHHPISTDDLRALRQLAQNTSAFSDSANDPKNFDIKHYQQDQKNLWFPQDRNCLVLADATPKGQKDEHGNVENGAMDNASTMFTALGYRVARVKDDGEVVAQVDAAYARLKQPVCLIVVGHGSPGRLGIGKGKKAVGGNNDELRGDNQALLNITEKLRGKVRSVHLMGCNTGDAVASSDVHVAKSLAWYLTSDARRPVLVTAFDHTLYFEGTRTVNGRVVPGRIMGEPDKKDPKAPKEPPAELISVSAKPDRVRAEIVHIPSQRTSFSRS